MTFEFLSRQQAASRTVAAQYAALDGAGKKLAVDACTHAFAAIDETCSAGKFYVILDVSKLAGGPLAVLTALLRLKGYDVRRNHSSPQKCDPKTCGGGCSASGCGRVTPGYDQLVIDWSVK